MMWINYFLRINVWRQDRMTSKTNLLHRFLKVGLPLPIISPVPMAVSLPVSITMTVSISTPISPVPVPISVSVVPISVPISVLPSISVIVSVSISTVLLVFLVLGFRVRGHVISNISVDTVNTSYTCRWHYVTVEYTRFCKIWHHANKLSYTVIK